MLAVAPPAAAGLVANAPPAPSTVLASAPPAPAADPASIRAEFDDTELRRIVRLSPLGPPPPDPSGVADDPRAAHLGRLLFFEPRLSGDGTRSCATCHDPRLGFADGRPLPVGAGEGSRHTPSLWNVAYNRWYFWDGRADSLWAQALEPIERAGELGGSRLQAARLIHDDPELRRAWEEAFGDLPDLGDRARFPAAGGPRAADPALVAAWEGMAEADRAAVDRVFVAAGKAIGAYERLLVSRDAPFDRFVAALRGEDPRHLAALGPAARRGLRLFVGRAQCRLCHGGPGFTDGEFHDTGVPARPAGGETDAGRFAGIRLLRLSPFNAAGRWNDDPGGPAAERLAHLADRPETWGQWKTPGLRNVAVTAPYMHQGQLATLRQVIEHYSTLRGAAFGGHHRETVLRPLGLTGREIDDLAAFLESLTDEAIDPDLLRPP